MKIYIYKGAICNMKTKQKTKTKLRLRKNFKTNRFYRICNGEKASKFIPILPQCKNTKKITKYEISYLIPFTAIEPSTSISTDIYNTNYLSTLQSHSLSPNPVDSTSDFDFPPLEGACELLPWFKLAIVGFN